MDNLSLAQIRARAAMEKAIAGTDGILKVELPEHALELGDLIRRCLSMNDLSEFRDFMLKHEIEIPESSHEAFRDFLIVNRLDLKDLEPDARERLRALTLSNEDSACMTADYKAVVESGRTAYCRSCRWFMSSPEDGDNAGKSCVQMGTKGADKACFGYTM